MLCQDCEKYSTCTELCEDAEEYVNQDHVGASGNIILKSKIYPVDWPEDIDPFNFTRTENKILILQEKNFSSIQISYLLGIKSNTFKVHMCNIRKKLKK